MKALFQALARAARFILTGVGILALGTLALFLFLFFRNVSDRLASQPTEPQVAAVEPDLVPEGTTVRKMDGTPLAGKEKEKALEALNLVRVFDKAMENSTPQMSEKERDEYARNVWRGIKSHMIDPEPGTYPVKFFDPKDSIPLAVGELVNAKWIDNQRVVYWGGIFNKVIPPSGRPFSHFELVVANVDTGVVEQTIQTGREPAPICFDVSTGNFLYLLLWAPKGGIITYYGRLGKDGKYEPRFNSDEKPKMFWNRITCDAYSDIKLAQSLIRPEDGDIAYAPSALREDGRWGDFVYTKPNGETKEFSIGMLSPPRFVYDFIRDQYFSSLAFSMEDQRSKILYFDRSFNLVDEFVLPRTTMQSSFPSSMLGSMALSPPAKDGFVTKCGARNDAPGSIDADGEQRRQYLCHVRRDQKIVRAVTGEVGRLAVSPDGCRVFGYLKERNEDKVESGKNFVVDVCKTEQEKQGQSK